MNKLGFVITLASQGARNAIECNKGQWLNKVVDIREYLKLFNGLQGTDNIVTFMSFDESGCFLTQLRAIKGRGGDFLSGWIYIPNSIEATGKDVMNAYNFVRNILSQSNLNESMVQIEEFFSKPYPQKYAVQYSQSSGEKFGVRYTPGFFTMEEILDVDRYQPYYSSYKAIFLLDKNGEVKIANDQVTKFDDLTKETINKYCIFLPPSPEELRYLGGRTKIVLDLKTRREFNSPITMGKGEKIQLYAIREGFEPIPLPVVSIQEEEQKYSINLNALKWMKRISASMFTVVNSEHKKIEKDVQISIGGKEITNHEALISENDCSHITVKITAPGYKVFEQEINLLAGNHEIKLSREVKKYKATIMLANNEKAEMTIESKYISTNTQISPLKGYNFEEDFHGDKYLKISSWFIWKQRIKGFLSAIIMAILIVAFVGLEAWMGTHHFKFGLPPWEKDYPVQTDSAGGSYAEDGEHPTPNSDPSQAEDLSLDKAIEYLDKNNTWKKSEMDKYPDLKGLFDDMNNFNFNNLLNVWKTKLSNSEEFMKVCKSAEKNRSKGWNPRQEPHNPTYNKQNDEQINRTNYIKWIDQDHTPSPDDVNNASKIGKGKTKKGEKTAVEKAPKENSKKQKEENGGL